MFGLSAGAAPDRFLVGLAVLSLLSEAADERPLLCVVDDAQWLDHASALTLAFVARRLLAEPVGIVFAAREPGEELQHLPELEVQRPARTATHERCWTRQVPFVLDERVRDRIIAETRGNPLALLELPRGLTRRSWPVGSDCPGAQALSGRIEESYIRRLEALPEDARRLLLVAAAEPIGDPLLLLSASERLGIAISAIERDGRIAGARGARDLPSSARALGGVPVRGRARAPSGAPGAGRRRRTRTPIRIVVRGISPLRRRVRTRRSRWSSSIRRAGRRRAAASPPRLRSCSVRWR